MGEHIHRYSMPDTLLRCRGDMICVNPDCVGDEERRCDLSYCPRHVILHMLAGHDVLGFGGVWMFGRDLGFWFLQK